MFEVQQRSCDTCIYRKDTKIDVRELEKPCRDPHMNGRFVSYRVCHQSNTACCRGFWNRYKNHFPLGQLAQRLKAVVFVQHTVHTSAARMMKKLKEGAGL